MDFLVEEHHLSVRQACKAIRIPRSTYEYTPIAKDDQEVILALGSLIESKPGIGFWQCHSRLKKKGYRWNHKKVYRI